MTVVTTQISESLPDTRTTSPAWFGNLVIVLFLVAQALDGIFTYLGIQAFGLSEGNPLIAYSFRHAVVRARSPARSRRG